MSAPAPAELRAVPLLADLAEEERAWLAAACEVREHAAGEVVFREGEPADTLFLVLEGEMSARSAGAAAGARSLTWSTGDVAGMLPFSRMTHWGGTARAETGLRLAAFPARRFPDLLARIPSLAPRLVQLMADRVRENTRADVQRDKLLSLGRLAAGLAHELNNPAAAAARAAAGLGEALNDVRERTVALAARLGTAPLAPLAECADGVEPPGPETPLARSDREEALAAWLEARGIEAAWRWAPTLAEAGAEVAWLEELGAAVPEEALAAALAWVEATLRARHLVRVVEGSTARISALVGAVKGYTYMDRAGAEEPVDVHEGLESTLLMLAHELRGRTLERDYAPGLPRILARGSELNQVWTNLLDNAAAAAGEGGRIRVVTRPWDGGVCVEVADTGKGIPPALLEQIWEPFFTTKPVGKGTGLGLDVVRRIVAAHGGEVRVRSEPGNTRFTVLLPARPPGG